MGLNIINLSSSVEIGNPDRKPVVIDNPVQKLASPV